jgi:hypothetical protein
MIDQMERARVAHVPTSPNCPQCRLKKEGQMKWHTILVIGCVSVLCFTYPAQSAPDITQAVSQDCRWDYHNFCSDYGIGSPLLNYCFRRNGAKLSRACVNALIQAGDVSRAYVQARRRAGH